MEVVVAMTSYAAPILGTFERLLLDEGGLSEPPDPNPDLMLCTVCADEYRSYWTEQWDEYRRSLL